jgi:hypothetical protein
VRALFRLIPIILSLALLLGEVLIRVLVAVTGRRQIVVSDARAGWKLPSNLRNLVRASARGSYALSTDAEGHRLTSFPGQMRSAAAAPAVIIVGDSFVQGVGVDDDETFAWSLAHQVPWHVVNLGVVGYGTDQELLILDAYLQAHANSEVRDVVVLLFDNDFVDVQWNFHPYMPRSKPTFRLVGGRLQLQSYSPTNSDRLKDVSFLYSFLCNRWSSLVTVMPPEAEGGVDLAIACLEEMRRLSTARQARFHVLVHRRLEGQIVEARLWQDFLRKSGAVDITERLRAQGPDVIGYDGGHWSAAGHQLVATIVKETIDAHP